MLERAGCDQRRQRRRAVGMAPREEQDPRLAAAEPVRIARVEALGDDPGLQPVLGLAETRKGPAAQTLDTGIVRVERASDLDMAQRAIEHRVQQADEADGSMDTRVGRFERQGVLDQAERRGPVGIVSQRPARGPFWARSMWLWASPIQPRAGPGSRRIACS